MNTLQKQFDIMLKREFGFPNIGILYIINKLEKEGITLNKFQVEIIRKQLIKLKYVGKIEIDLDVNQRKIIGLKNNEKKIIILDLTKTEIDLFIDKINRDVSDSIPEIINNIANDVFITLNKNLAKMLYHKDSIEKNFNSRLEYQWKSLFDLLSMFQVVSYEVARESHKINKKSGLDENIYVYDVLTRLQARACQITQEIIVLLKSGFADGAHARWRTLHEIAVIGYFIIENGNITAEKYILHENIESYKSALQYQEYAKILKEKLFTKKEMNEFKSKYDQLLKRFGNSFKNDYGWASTEIKKESPTFRDIEEKVSLDHFRPYYRMASNNVHANTKGTYFRMGLSNGEREILLAGPSNIGLIDPIQLTIISLGQITKILLTYKPNIDVLVFCIILDMIENELFTMASKFVIE